MPSSPLVKCPCFGEITHFQTDPRAIKGQGHSNPVASVAKILVISMASRHQHQTPSVLIRLPQAHQALNADATSTLDAKMRVLVTMEPAWRKKRRYLSGLLGELSVRGMGLTLELSMKLSVKQLYKYETSRRTQRTTQLPERVRKLSHVHCGTQPPLVNQSGLYFHGRKTFPPSKETSKSSVPQIAANDSCPESQKL